MSYDTLVLSGGGFKGIYTVGSLHYLESKGYLIDVKTIVGTSIGGLIGYLLILGYKPIDIFVFFFQKKLMTGFKLELNIANASFSQSTFENILKSLEELTLKKIGCFMNMIDFYEQYGIELVLVTYNSTEMKTEYLSYKTYPKLPVLTALKMTTNIPFLFEKFVYNKCNYLDGGMCDNFPIKFVDDGINKVLGINTGPIHVPGNQSHNMLSYLLHVVSIPLFNNYFSSFKDLTPNTNVIVLDSTRISTFELGQISNSRLFDGFSYGFNTTKRHFNDLSDDEDSALISSDTSSIDFPISINIMEIPSPETSSI